MNNDFMTYDEMADVTEEIISGKILKEEAEEISIVQDFAENFLAAREALERLVGIMKANQQYKVDRTPGSGDFTKILNLSNKLKASMAPVVDNATRLANELKNRYKN